MTTNSQLSTTEPKNNNNKKNQTNKLSKQLEQEQNHRNGDHMERYQWGGGKDTGNKKHKWQVQNRHGDIKNSIGNGVAKDLICRTHRHELREGIAGGNGGTWWRRAKRKNWENCNNIINKIY